MAAPGVAAVALTAAQERFAHEAEEFCYLTEVQLYTPEEARQILRRSDKTVYRWRAYLAEHPEVRLTVHEVYGDDGERIA